MRDGCQIVYSDPFDLVNADIEQILIGMRRFAMLLDKDKLAFSLRTALYSRHL